MAVKRRLVSVLCLFTGMTLAGYARFFWVRGHAPTRSSIARLGRQLPALPVVDASGTEVDIGKVALGSKSIIAFYSASCHVCQAVLPELHPFPPSLRLLLVDEEAGNSIESPHGLGIGRALVFQDRNNVLARSFPMSGVPTILFVDERGVLRGGLVGQHARGLVQRRLREFAETRP